MLRLVNRLPKYSLHRPESTTLAGPRHFRRSNDLAFSKHLAIASRRAETGSMMAIVSSPRNQAMPKQVAELVEREEPTRVPISAMCYHFRWHRYRD